MLERAKEAGVECKIVDTGRTPTEQQVKISQGVSWTNNSKHLPQMPEGKSEAIDIVPLSVLEEHKPTWSPEHPDWQKIGPIGEQLGLRWGGRWQKHPDPSHFEYVHAMPHVLDAELGVG